MSRRNRRGADQSWNDDDSDSTAPERSSPQPSQPAAAPPAAPKPSDGFTPLDPFPAAARIFGTDRLNQTVCALLVLGIVIRTIRYLLNFPLWPDEAYLAHNYLDRSFLELTQPLDYIQIAPILYLWLQHAILKLLGFSELTLRLSVFACSIGSLFLFRHLAGRLLQGSAYLLAFGTFAVAYPLTRYSAEAKPYGFDMFVSLALLTLTVEWYLAPDSRRWWWALTLALPLALPLSYPAAFVAGGIVATMAVVLCAAAPGCATGWRGASPARRSAPDSPPSILVLPKRRWPSRARSSRGPLPRPFRRSIP